MRQENAEVAELHGIHGSDVLTSVNSVSSIPLNHSAGDWNSTASGSERALTAIAISPARYRSQYCSNLVRTDLDARFLFHFRRSRGFTLLEMIITMAVLAIVVSASIPYMKNSIKRERELVLRRNLRTIRKAIDAYYVDCEFRKLISQLDRREGDMCYPPTLEALVEGIHPVNTSRTIRYLRRVPVDPMTGKAEWGVSAVQDDPGEASSSGKNVFDVHSLSREQALNGTFYKNW